MKKILLITGCVVSLSLSLVFASALVEKRGPCGKSPCKCDPRLQIENGYPTSKEADAAAKKCNCAGCQERGRH